MENNIENEMVVEEVKAETTQETLLTILDLGNMNIKYKGKVQGVISSRFTTDFQSYEEGFSRIELDGRKIYFEVGELQKEFNKAEKDFIPQMLFSICKAHPNEDIISTNLTLLLPTGQMLEKNKLIDKLKGKEFSFQYNGKDRVVQILNMLVLPEGYISFFSLTPEDKKGSIAIVDIGSRTINLAVVHNGKVEKLNTVKLGTYDFYSKIKNIENSKGESFVEEDIQRLIDENLIKVYQKDYVKFLNDVVDSIRSYCNLKTYKVIFTGGGSVMLAEYIDKLPLPNMKLHSDPLNSNLLGAYEASKLAWKLV